MVSLAKGGEGDYKDIITVHFYTFNSSMSFILANITQTHTLFWTSCGKIRKIPYEGTNAPFPLHSFWTVIIW